MSEEKKEAIVIPYKKLSAAILESLISEYILREGTDYGVKEYTLQEKQQQVLSLLEEGKALILFDSETESCSLILKENFHPN